MKQKQKHLNVLVSLVLLVFAVVCLVNITYSYFTTTSNIQGNFTFGDLDVTFIYNAGGDTTDEGGNTIQLYSAAGAIEIGTPFKLSATNGGTPITLLGMRNKTSETPCFIRFWIDAYIKDGNYLDKSVNYGQYFKLTADEDVFTSTNSSAGNSSCYYILDAVDSAPVYISNELTLVDADDNILANILGETIQISLTFEAVQCANKAYLSAFDDEKGYYNGDYWSEWGEDY